jgi:hypothetical protein
MEIMTDIVLKARKYINLPEGRKMDETERYYNPRTKEYDAFLAGANSVHNNDLHKISKSTTYLYAQEKIIVKRLTDDKDSCEGEHTLTLNARFIRDLPNGNKLFYCQDRLCITDNNNNEIKSSDVINYISY